MRIFLSFPSELEATAEAIAQSLRNRDYDVFFSHEDLPPGDSFDARVETAIAQSDFMVFLVSPQSVTKGRYTLTEMVFAREKWPNPSNRVLPVMAVATPVESIPSYLRAVTILDPEGSIAAETRAAVDRILRSPPSASKLPMLILAALALLSAIGSNLAMDYSPEVLKFSFIQATDVKAPILPGVLFGAVVATCNAIFGVRDRFQLGLAIVVTTVAWIAAFDSGAVISGLLVQYSRQAGPNLSTTEYLSANPVTLYIVGLAGGAIGGAITILGLLITNPGFRRVDSVVVSWTTATLVGAGAYGIANHLLVLFGIWQPAVILAIVYGLLAEKAELPAWLSRITALASYTSRGAG